jgi:hypothetical protein
MGGVLMRVAGTHNFCGTRFEQRVSELIREIMPGRALVAELLNEPEG